jgi:hypothetical protein
LNELALFSAKTHRRHNQISVNTLIVVSPAAGTFWDFHNFDINPVSPVDLGQPTSMVRNLHEEIPMPERRPPLQNGGPCLNFIPFLT